MNEMHHSWRASADEFYLNANPFFLNGISYAIWGKLWGRFFKHVNLMLSRIVNVHEISRCGYISN